MQRLRETSRGLEFTQGTDVVTLNQDKHGDVKVWENQSSLHDPHEHRLYVIEGRDNMHDFGKWLTRLSAKNAGDDPTTSNFTAYTLDEYKRLAAVSIPPAKRGSGLADFLAGEEENIGTDTIEEIHTIIDTVGELLGSPPRNLTRAETEAFAYPFGIPAGMTPILLATQTFDNLQLQLDEVHIHNAIPLEAAQQLGAWSLLGMSEIQKKSFWC